MSKALRCDKCGTTFSPLLIGTTDLFTTIPELYFQNRDDFIHNICNQRKKELNLCPVCTNKFLAFMEDFENETDHLYTHAVFVDDKSDDTWRDICREHEHGGSQGNCDGKTSERKD